MGSPYEEQNILTRDWITCSVLWLGFLIASWLVRRLCNLAMADSKSKSPATAQTSASGRTRNSSSGSLPQTRWLLRIFVRMDALKLVAATGLTTWCGLLLDVVSWAYILVFQVWDWFVVVVDAISTFASGVASALLLLIFIQRCFLTLDNCLSQHSAHVYEALTGMALIVALWALAMGIFAGTLQWRLLAAAAIGFTFFLFVTVSAVTFLFYRSLRLVSLEIKSPLFLHLAVRVAVVSVLTMCSTCLTYLSAAVAYNFCGECRISYIYYNLTTVDAVVVLTCLMWSLKQGQLEYYQWCSCLHSFVFGAVSKGKATATLPRLESGIVAEDWNL